MTSESSASDLFLKKTEIAVKIMQDAGDPVTRESLNSLQDAVRETMHSYSYEKRSDVWYGYNYAQNTGITTTDKGVKIYVREGDIEYILKTIGREEVLQPAEDGEVTTEGRLLTILRSGYSEWYRNNDDSIIQGMDIVKRPEGDGNLIIRFDLSGNLTPSMENQFLLLSYENRTVLKYGDLNAWDSTGKTLETAMTLSGNTLAWEVDDSQAFYPITIDPEFTLAQSEYGSIGSGSFGWSVAVSGDYAVVGECGNDTIRSGAIDQAGAAYFYKTYDGGETWTLKQSEYGSVAEGKYGWAVSVSDDYAMVGEYQNATIRPGGVIKAGAAYFYKTYNGGETWKLKQAEYGSISFGGLGHSVSVSGDYAMIGEYYNDTIRSGMINGAGAAYFYKTYDDGETWTLKQSKYGSVVFGRFGSSVSVSGNYAIVGERFNDTIRSGILNGAGAVYFYRTDDGGEAWTLKQAEYGSIVNGFLGNSVAVSGDYAIVGEYGNDTIQTVAVNEAGAAYFYKTTDGGETWTLKQSKYGSVADGRFGWSVSISDEYAAVGECQNDTIRSGTVDQAGAAYLYRTSDDGDTWNLLQSVHGSIVNGYLGNSVAVSEDYAIVGEYGNNTIRQAALNEAGAVYFYIIPPVIETYSPAIGSANVPSGSNLRLKFDKNVAAVAGKNIRIYKSDDTLVQTIAAKGPAVTVAGTTVTINPNDFSYSTGYYVLIDAGAFKNSATNVPFAGIPNKNIWTFTTRAQPPPESNDGENEPNSNIGVGISYDLKAGETAKMPTRNENNAVRSVDVTVNKDLPSVMVLVKKLDTLPSRVTVPQSKNYQFLDISILKVDSMDINSATIHFSVLKSWLDENGIKADDIVLKRYNEETKEWTELLTELESIGGGNAYYKAITSGFI